MKDNLWASNPGIKDHKQGDMYPLLSTLEVDHHNPNNEPGDSEWQGGPQPSIQTIMPKPAKADNQSS